MNNNLSKEFVNEEGAKETIIANSSDNYKVKLDNNYKLVGHEKKNESKFAKKFKNSILGADIGVKSSGFSSIIGLSVVIVLTVVFILYLMWRF